MPLIDELEMLTEPPLTNTPPPSGLLSPTAEVPLIDELEMLTEPP